MLTNVFALYAREVKRFQKIWLDTVVSPLMSMVLFLAVFGIVSGDRMVGGLPYLAFVYTGLLTMTMVNASFSNPAFALVISKNLGSIIDIQLAPLPNWGIGIAYALAACTRALLTLAVALLITIWFIPIHGISHPILLLLGLVLTGLEFGMLGVCFGMYAKNFEALTFVTTFIVQPMIFLAGVFYPVASLPGIWPMVSQFNPMHHSVNLLRYATTGYADTAPMLSLGVIVSITVAVFVLMQWLTKKKLNS
ncbi:ABC transporter permease [Candidatus Uhrbacteria bacterium]|nr:ABC transporter permease [Candidatus Uhrbacteria bacterium]